MIPIQTPLDVESGAVISQAKEKVIVNEIESDFEIPIQMLLGVSDLQKSQKVLHREKVDLSAKPIQILTRLVSEVQKTVYRENV